MIDKEVATKAISSLTKTKLLELASENDIPVKKSWNKSKILEMLSNSLDKNVVKAIVDDYKSKMEKKRPKKERTGIGKLLEEFTDEGRLSRGEKIDDKVITRIEPFEAGYYFKIKGSGGSIYRVQIGTEKKAIIHDCTDWGTRCIRDRLFCKHIVKSFLTLPKEEAEKILKRMTSEKGRYLPAGFI